MGESPTHDIGSSVGADAVTMRTALTLATVIGAVLGPIGFVLVVAVWGPI